MRYVVGCILFLLVLSLSEKVNIGTIPITLCIWQTLLLSAHMTWLSMSVLALYVERVQVLDGSLVCQLDVVPFCSTDDVGCFVS